MRQIIVFDINTHVERSTRPLDVIANSTAARGVAQLSWLGAEIMNSDGHRHYRPDTLQAKFCNTPDEERDVVRAFDAMLLEQALNEGPPKLVGFNSRERGMPTLIARARAKAMTLLPTDSEVEMRNISYLAQLNADEHCDLYSVAALSSDFDAGTFESVCRTLKIPLVNPIQPEGQVALDEVDLALLYHEFRVLSIWLVFLRWSLATGDLTASGYAASLRATVESVDGAAVTRPEFRLWTGALKNLAGSASPPASRQSFPQLRVV
jgi:hypothetical protein